MNDKDINIGLDSEVMPTLLFYYKVLDNETKKKKRQYMRFTKKL